MFKFETVVKMSLALALVTSGAMHAFAKDDEEDDSKSSSGDRAQAEALKIANANCEKSGKADSQSCKTRDSMMAAFDPNSCSAKAAKFNGSVKAYEAACKKVGYTTGGETGHVACSAQRKKCLDETENLALEDSDDEGSSLDFTKNQMKACPDIAGKDLKELREELKEAKEDLNKLEDKIPDLQKEAHDIYKDTQESVKNIKATMLENTQTFEKSMTELERKYEGEVQAAISQIAEIQSQVNDVIAEIDRVGTERKTAQVKLEDTKSQIRMNCHGVATNQVAERQTLAMKMIAAGEYNRGGFNKMLTNVGASDRHAWQRLAMEYYNDCIRGAPTKASFKSAERAFELSLKDMDTRENLLRQKRKSLEQQIARVKSPKGCGDASAADTSVCIAYRRAQVDMQQAVRNYSAQQNKLNQDLNETVVTGANEYRIAQEKLTRAQSKFEEENIRVSNLKDMYALKVKASTRGSITEETLNALFDAESETEGLARSLAGECKDYCAKNTGNCDKAIQFAQLIDHASEDSPPPSDAIAGATDPIISTDKDKLDPAVQSATGVRRVQGAPLTVQKRKPAAQNKKPASGQQQEGVR